MSKAILEFLQSLSGEEEARLLRKLKRSMYAYWPTTRAEEIKGGFVLPTVEREIGADEQQRLDAHAAAVATMAAALGAWRTAQEELRTAQRLRGPEGADGYRHASPEHAASVERAREAEQEAHDAYDQASLAEVAARPHQSARQRRRLGFPMIGRIVGRPS
jgi:hypothetical protein